MTHKLIVAVSGGVDSVVLLDMLAGGDHELVVAHVDHGIRGDSREDEALVRRLAEHHRLPYESTRLELGPDVSEEQARTKRYAWLEQVAKKHGADMIATAHHQDDVLETIIFNLLRGTGWRGLCSLRSTERLYRPLLGLSKAEIIAHALEHRLEWREDSTNESMRYTRNRIRSLVIPRLTPTQRAELSGLYQAQLGLRVDIEHDEKDLLAEYGHGDELLRHPLIMCEDVVAVELLRAWLGIPLETARLESLLRFVKVAKVGDKWSLDAKRFVVAKRTSLIVSAHAD